MLPTKFQVNWLLGLGEAVKKRFSRWPPWWPSWISDQHHFSYFWSTSHPDASYQVWSQLAFWLWRWCEKYFQDGGHLGFPIGTILAIFDLHVTPFFLPSFVSTGLSVQEWKPKIDFQDGGHGGHLGFQIGKILAIFDLQVMLPTKLRVNWHLGLGEEVKNRFSRWPPWRPFWIYNRKF